MCTSNLNSETSITNSYRNDFCGLVCWILCFKLIVSKKSHVELLKPVCKDDSTQVPVGWNRETAKSWEQEVTTYFVRNCQGNNKTFSIWPFAKIQPMFRLGYSKGFINVASCRREIQFYLPASSTVGHQYRSGEQDVQASLEIHCQTRFNYLQPTK